MNKEHTKKLFEIAPVFYSGRKLPITRNLMSFGFECGDGWYYPLRTLSSKIEMINILGEHLGVSVKALQVKEKFGTLRVYFDVHIKLVWWKRLMNFILHPLAKMTKYRHFLGFDNSQRQISFANAINDIVEEMIDDCEKECMNYCEECGKQFGNWNKDQKVQTTGWIRIVCKDCAEKNGWPYKTYDEAISEEME